MIAVRSPAAIPLVAQRTPITKFTPRQQFLQLSLVKADHVQIEVLIAQRRQFRSQHCVVLPGVFGNPIVSDDQGAALGLQQMVQHAHRHPRQAEGSRRHQPPMPGDDHVVLADQDWIGETEFAIKAALCAT